MIDLWNFGRNWLYSGGKSDLKNYRAGKERVHCFLYGMVEMQPVSLRTANKYTFKHATKVIVTGTLYNVYSIIIIIIIIII